VYNKGFRNFKILQPGKGKIDIVSNDAGKQKALELLHTLDYLNEHQVARFGDQGQPGGNDEKMLLPELGFQVQGPTHTQEILSELRVKNRIVKPKETFSDQALAKGVMNRYQGAASEARENFRSKQEVYKSSAQENAFYNADYINSLKFSFIGSIILNKNDLEVSQSSPFYKFIHTPSILKADKMKYFLNHGEKFHNRSEGFYCTEKKAVGLESPLERFKMLSVNCLELISFLPDIQNTLIDNSSLKDQEFKLGVAYYDNLKGSLMHLFHAYSYLLTQGILTDEQSLNESLRNYVDVAIESYFNLVNLQPPKLMELASLADSLNLVSNKVNQALESNLDNKAIGKSVRGIMEADSPDQVNLFAMNIADEIIRDYTGERVILVGMHFGGAELPYAVKAALQRKGFNIELEIVSAHYSNYSNKSASFSNGYFDRQSDFNHADVFLLDDGVFTGGSLARVMDEIASQGGNVLPRTMQIGNGRRLGHMMKSGGVDPDFLDGQISKNAVGITPSARAMSEEKYERLEEQDKFNLMQMRVSQMMSKYYNN
jgi:hypothetical protein